MYVWRTRKETGELLNNNKLTNKRFFNIYFLLYFRKRTDFSICKVQISQFAKNRFLNMQSTDFAKYNKPFSHSIKEMNN